MKKHIIALAIALALASGLTGCSSPLDAISGIVGSKPDVTAQVGAENTKQAVGISGKVDASNETKNELKNSKIDNMDTSNGKKVSASSIQADSIQADRIEIRNNESSWESIAGFFIVGLMVGATAVTIYSTRRNKGA
jgi:hypothetical protein